MSEIQKPQADLSWACRDMHNGDIRPLIIHAVARPVSNYTSRTFADISGQVLAQIMHAAAFLLHDAAINEATACINAVRGDTGR